MNEITRYSNEKELNEICVVARQYGRLQEIIEALEYHGINYIFLDDFKKEKIEKKYSFLFKRINDAIAFIGL